MEKKYQLEARVKALMEDVPSTKQVVALLSALYAKIEASKAEVKKMSDDSASASAKEVKTVAESLKSEVSAVVKSVNALVKGSSKEHKAAIKAISKEVSTIAKALNGIKQFDPTEVYRKISQVEDSIVDAVSSIPRFELKAPEVRDSLETLKGDDRLDKSAIKGIERLEESMRLASNELRQLSVRPYGSVNALRAKQDGILISDEPIHEINLGPGLTGTVTGKTLNITATAGGTPEIPTGAIDGSNTVFDFAVAPQKIVVDQGRFLIVGDGFTVSGTQATLDVAPTFSIFSI